MLRYEGSIQIVNILKEEQNTNIKREAMKKIIAILGGSFFLILALTGCQKKANLPNNGLKPADVLLGGKVSGLFFGESITITNSINNNSVTVNGVDLIPTAVNFSFPLKIATGDTFNASVTGNATGRTCNVNGNVGTVGNSDVNSISIDCSGGVVTYSIGGTVTLTGGAATFTVPLVLQNTINGDYAIIPGGATASFPYTFSTGLAAGTSYNVVVASQPMGPAQNCSITTPGTQTGTVSAIVSNINITCSPATFNVGGTINGLLSGEAVTLSITYGATTVNTGFTAPIAGSPYSFSFPGIPDGSAYTVSAITPPPGKTCSVTNGGGTVAGGSINNIYVSCNGSGTFTVGGDATTGITGLEKNATITFNLTGTATETLSITNTTGAASLNLPYAFSKTLATGANYTVTITNPTSPSQNCTFGGAATGVVGAGNVILPLVTCVTNSFTVSFNVIGLTANGGGGNLQVAGYATPISADGTYSFAPQLDGTAYTVAVTSAPPSCSVSITGQATGVLQGANINPAATINCNAAPTSTVSAQVTGINVTAGTGLILELNANAADQIQFPAITNITTTKTFLTGLPSGASYSITIIQQPDRAAGNGLNQVCVLPLNATGTMGTANITITISCSTVAYTVGGTVTANSLLSPEQITVVNSTTGEYKVLTDASGTGAAAAYSFGTAVPDGTLYNLSFYGSFPYGKDCTFSAAGTGTITGANAVQDITCSAKSQAGISVIVNGSVPTGLQIKNTILGGPAPETITINNTGTFPFTVLPYANDIYSLSIVTQPGGLVCGFTSTNAGIMSYPLAAAVTVSVSCTTNTGNQFTLGGTVTGLATGESVTLQNNIGEQITVPGNTGFPVTFAFNQTYMTGAYYNVDMTSFTSVNFCSISNSSGYFTAANVNTVTITCGPDAYEADNSLTTDIVNITAHEILVDSSSPVHTIHIPTDVDYFPITVLAATQYYIGVSNGSGGCNFDPRIDIVDAAGAAVTVTTPSGTATGADGGGIGLCPSLSGTFATAGTYYVKVSDSALAVGPNQRGSYVLGFYQLVNIFSENFTTAGTLGQFTSNDLGSTTGFNSTYNIWNNNSLLVTAKNTSYLGYTPPSGTPKWSAVTDGAYAFASADVAYAAYGNSLRTDLVSPVLDLTTPTLYSNKVILTYDFGYKTGILLGFLGEFVKVQIKSSKTGGVWQTLIQYPTTAIGYVEHRSLDITYYASGDPAVQIRFFYFSKDWTFYTFVDNVNIWAK